MALSFEDRVKMARDKILPILAEYKLDIGTKHFWKKDAPDARNILDFVGSEVQWLDREEKGSDVVEDASPSQPN